MNKYAELLRRSADEHEASFAESDLTRELRAAADEIEKATPVAWETISGDLIRNDGNQYNEYWEPLYHHPAPVVPQLAKHQPCGCVICTCTNDVQCQGCGATHCGTHPVGEFPAPVFETAPENEWKAAIDHELVMIGTTADTFDSPREAITELLDWHVQVALDPVVSSKAASLHEETEQLRTTLTDALNWYERQAQTLGDFEMVERMKKALGI